MFRLARRRPRLAPRLTPRLTGRLARATAVLAAAGAAASVMSGPAFAWPHLPPARLPETIPTQTVPAQTAPEETPDPAQDDAIKGLLESVAPEPEPEEDEAAGENVAIDGAPAMWRVSDDDSHVILFGTLHVLPRDLDWTTPAFFDAMRRTGTTMLETDVDGPAAAAQMEKLVSKYGLNQKGVRLSSVIGPARTKRLKALAGRLGVPMESLEPQRPWLALVGLTALAMQQAGFDADHGAEATVLARAKLEGDRIAHLERLKDQIRALASLDEGEMLANFDASLDQLDDFSAIANAMLTAWRAGDTDALEALVLGELRRDAPEAYDALIVRRNRAWTKKIDKLLRKDDDYFIAVGAGHLIGEESVIAALRRKGYAVERIQ